MGLGCILPGCFEVSSVPVSRDVCGVTSLPGSRQHNTGRQSAYYLLQLLR